MIEFPVSKPKFSGVEQELVNECFANNWLTHGPMVARFEQAFATLQGVKHALACSSGTTALHLALLALGIGPGDEVLVPNLSFVATANAVSYTGATPVLVDIEPQSWAIDLKKAEAAVTERTKVIIVVHLYGQPADMDNVIRMAAHHGLRVVEDAAEGFGHYWSGVALGAFGDIGTYSFYGNKILTTGEGGMCVTDDVELANKIHHFRGQAQHPTFRYYHTAVGYNYRMTDVQAAIGLGQLTELNANLRKRHDVFDRYTGHFEKFQHVDLNSAPWLFTVVLPDGIDATRLAQDLFERGIETRPVFVPMNRLPMYAQPDEQFPVSVHLSEQGLSLPTYPQLELLDVDYIARMVVNGVSQQENRRKQA